MDFLKRSDIHYHCGPSERRSKRTRVKTSDYGRNPGPTEKSSETTEAPT